MGQVGLAGARDMAAIRVRMILATPRRVTHMASRHRLGAGQVPNSAISSAAPLAAGSPSKITSKPVMPGLGPGIHDFESADWTRNRGWPGQRDHDKCGFG